MVNYYYFVFIKQNIVDSRTRIMQTFPMAVASRAIPWWGIPVNWLFGKYPPLNRFLPNNLGFLIKSSLETWLEVFSSLPSSSTVRFFFELCIPLFLANIWPDTAIISTQPYIDFIQEFAM